jgi:plastocyanin
MCVALPLAAIGGDVRPEQPAGSVANVATYTVSIANMQFEPAELSVKRGSRIVWVNKDFFPHTATASAFDSGSIKSDASWTYVADEPGAYAYICTLHPMMKGRLVVQ